MSDRIFYRKTNTYKYVTEKDAVITLPNSFFGPISHGEYLTIKGGVLIIKKGYRWDGPSGISLDTKSFMRGSLFHDALYQLLREGVFSIDLRKAADKLLIAHCKKDKMNWFRRQYVYAALRIGGRSSARPSNSRAIQTAP